MAKADDIEIHPWEPYAAAGARIVRVRADELVRQAEHVLDVSDIERVHAMRVTSRRLRAVLEIFAPCFPRDEYRDVVRDVKRLADALGERRDPDVHIAAMERFGAAAATAHRGGIASLVATARADQEAGNRTLAAELERAARTDLHGRLLRLATHAEEAIAPDEPEPEPEVEPDAPPAPAEAGVEVGGDDEDDVEETAA